MCLSSRWSRVLNTASQKARGRKHGVSGWCMDAGIQTDIHRHPLSPFVRDKLPHMPMLFFSKKLIFPPLPQLSCRNTVCGPPMQIQCKSISCTVGPSARQSSKYTNCYRREPRLFLLRGANRRVELHWTDLRKGGSRYTLRAPERDRNFPSTGGNASFERRVFFSQFRACPPPRALLSHGGSRATPFLRGDARAGRGCTHSVALQLQRHARQRVRSDGACWQRRLFVKQEFASRAT